MRATLREGRNAIWSIDPMHGNTRSLGRFKTRLLRDIVSEVSAFFDVADAVGVHPGGFHLDMTGSDGSHCLGGSLPLSDEDLSRRYLSHYHPRFHRSPAMPTSPSVTPLLPRPRLRTPPND